MNTQCALGLCVCFRIWEDTSEREGAHEKGHKTHSASCSELVCSLSPPSFCMRWITWLVSWEDRSKFTERLCFLLSITLPVQVKSMTLLMKSDGGYLVEWGAVQQNKTNLAQPGTPSPTGHLASLPQVFAQVSHSQWGHSCPRCLNNPPTLSVFLSCFIFLCNMYRYLTHYA